MEMELEPGLWYALGITAWFLYSFQVLVDGDKLACEDSNKMYFGRTICAADII